MTDAERKKLEAEYRERFPEEFEEEEEEEELAEEELPEVGPLEAGLRSAGQIATLGGSDEAIAKGQASYDKFVDSYDPYSKETDTYDQHLAEQRQREKAGFEQNPWTSVGAGLTTAALMSAFGKKTGRAIAKRGVPLQMARLGKLIHGSSPTVRSIASGLGYGVGTSEKKISEDPLGVGKDALEGGALAFGADKVIRAGGQGLKQLPTDLNLKAVTKHLPSKERVLKSIDRASKSRGIKAAIGHSKKNLMKIFRMNRKDIGSKEKYEKDIDEIGDILLNEWRPIVEGVKKGAKTKGEKGKERLMGWYDDIDDIGAKAGDAMNEYGEMIGNIGEGMDALIPKGSVNFLKIRKEIEDYAEKLDPANQEYLAIKAELERTIDLWKKTRPDMMTFAKAMEIKAQFDWKPETTSLLVNNQKIRNKIHMMISEGMSDAIDTMAANPKRLKSFFTKDKQGRSVIGGEKMYAEALDLLKEYPQIKRKFGAFKDIASSALERSVGNLANRIASPTDYAVALTGMSSGAFRTAKDSGAFGVANLFMGAVAGMLNNLGRNRGNAFLARTLHGIHTTAKKNPEFGTKWAKKLTSRGSTPAKMVLTHRILMSKDPEYKKAYDEANEGEQFTVDTWESYAPLTEKSKATKAEALKHMGYERNELDETGE